MLLLINRYTIKENAYKMMSNPFVGLGSIVRKVFVVPRRLDKVYMLCFIITSIISIILFNLDEGVYRSYTSCHGKATYEFVWFWILLFLQCMLLLPVVNDDSDSNSCNVIVDFVKNESTISEENDLTFVRCATPDETVVAISSNFTGHEQIIDLGMLYKTQSAQVDADQQCSGRNRGAANSIGWVDSTKKWNRRFLVCWSSMWMISYNLIIFMAIHASLLASRVHGAIDLNKYGLETCGHLKNFPLNLGSPALSHPLINEYVFMVTYLSFIVHSLVVRRTADAGFNCNFIGRHLLKDGQMLGVLRILIQTLLFTSVVVLIILSIVNGFGSPMHVTVGFAMAMLFLWNNSSMCHLLQLNQVTHLQQNPLSYNWLWALLVAGTLWLCGFLFYLTVYGVSLLRPYLYIQVLSWLPALFITYYKGREIFLWEDFNPTWDEGSSICN